MPVIISNTSTHIFGNIAPILEYTTVPCNSILTPECSWNINFMFYEEREKILVAISELFSRNEILVECLLSPCRRLNQLCKQILSSSNGVLTKSIMVTRIKILLIHILIHIILAIGSILAVFHTICLQCKFQFGQINLIVKSWFVQSKISGYDNVCSACVW